MIKEEDQTIPPAVIAARAKKGLAIATGNPLDKIVISPPEKEKTDVQTEETLIERVVSIMQRRKRALQMKRRKPRITRARNIKRTRLASQEQLMRRATRMAKTMLRKRAAGARGANYSKLSPAQKMNIDRQIEPRTKNIKAMATRLMPRVKAGEMRRLNAVRSHKSTKGVYGNVQNLTQSYQPVIYSKLLGERVNSEDLNAMFSMYEGKFISAITAPIRGAAKVVRGAAVTAAALQTPQTQAAATLAAANWATKKLANFGKSDPEKEKKASTDKHTEKMNQQALIQSKERTKQAQLKTKQMQQKPAISGSPKTSTASSAPTPSSTAAPKQQTQSAPKQQPSSALASQSAPAASAPQPTSNTATQQSSLAQRISQIKSNIKNPSAPSAQAVSSVRQQKQAAAAKAARQQMGLVNHKEWDYESYLQEKVDQHLQKKANKYNANFEELKLVFEQGLADYVENSKTTLHQFAMQRVNTHLADSMNTGQSLDESFVVDRASGYSGVYTAKDLGIKMQGGFALHPSVEEDYGAGFEGTNKLTNKYKKDTPGEAVEAFARMLRAKRKANTPC